VEKQPHVSTERFENGKELLGSVKEHTGTVSTSQETHSVSATEPNRLMLFGKTVAVYCEKFTEHTDKMCGQTVELF
jgi:thioredoxin-related protein